MISPRRSDLRSEFVRHPVVRRIQEQHGSGCVREAARHLAFEAVGEARRFGWAGPPYDMNLLASLRGMRVEIADWLGPGQDGCLVPGRPPIIYIGDRVRRTRARYTIAHEIGHTLLPGYNASSGERRWKYRHDGQSPVEQLCQAMASEMLMPSDSFADFVAGRSESLSLIRDMASTFVVSHEAAARTMVDRSRGECAMAILEMANKPSELQPVEQIGLPGIEPPAPPKRLRLVYGWTSRGLDGLYLPPFKSIPDDSVLYGLFSEYPGPVAAAEDWTDFGGIGAIRIEAMAVGGRGTEPRVLAFLVR